MKDNEFYILKELSLNSNLTQRELSNRLGLSLGGINYVLRALIKKGYVKMQKFKDSHNKARYIYILTPKWAYDKAKLTSSFINSKIAEYENLQREIEQLKKDIE
ncbi:MAG: MarR family EPS-associated transcriptional regulator [Syntrophorhabdaceae bacterium]|nr:MarR family EPS-associated transcriptional regulator [Syntrophorhabdaceae bacterium]